MTAGDYLALAGMAIVLIPMVVAHIRATRRDRRAQRELTRVLGHPARQLRATRDARITEQTWGRS